MRGTWVALLPVLLSGCILPPAVAVGTYAADGASYAVSDKSLSDHGVSTVTNKDCATWHFFVGRAVCEDPNHPVPMAAFDDRGGNAPEILNAPMPKPKPILVAAPAGAAGSGTAEALERKSLTASVPQSGKHYLVIGSFTDRQRAERVAQSYADYHAQVVPVMKGGREMSRVVLGPLDPAQVAALRGRSVPGYLAQPPEPAAGLIAAKANGPQG
jgi:hypothetical protein